METYVKTQRSELKRFCFLHEIGIAGMKHHKNK